MRPLRSARFATAVWLLAVLALTLYPATPTHTSISPLCIGCGEYATVDALVNIVLFVPLGFFGALGWPQPRHTALAAIVLSLTVEIAQHYFVPGRFGSAQDLLTNAAGAVTGIALARALPTLSRFGQTQRWATALGTAVATTVTLWATPALLQPSLSTVELWGQIAPQKHRDFAPYPGTISSFTVNGIAIPYGQLSPLDPNDPFHRQRPTIILRGVGAPPSHRITALARLITPWNEQVMIAERNGQLIFRVRQRSRDFKLRQPFAGFDSLSPGTGLPFEIRAQLLRDRWVAHVVTPLSADSAALPISVGLGWSFLFPWNQPLTPASTIANACWLALLCFASALAALPLGRMVAAGSVAWFLGGGVLLGTRAWGLFTPTPVEWFGAILGAGAALALFPPLRRTLKDVVSP